MQPVSRTSVIQTIAGGSVATPGSVVGTSIDWGPTYVPDTTMYASCGAVSAGTVTMYAQGSDDDSSWNSLGSAVFADQAGGTATKTVDLDPRVNVYRYVRGLAVVAGGTVTSVTAGFIGQPRIG